MEIFYYELFFEEEGLMILNVLFSESRENALEFFDEYFLELHNTREETPTWIRLFTKDESEELARFTMHFDALVT